MSLDRRYDKKAARARRHWKKPSNRQCDEDEHFWPVRDTGTTPNAGEPCNCGSKTWPAAAPSGERPND